MSRNSLLSFFLTGENGWNGNFPIGMLKKTRAAMAPIIGQENYLVF